MDEFFTLLHLNWPKLYGFFAVLSAIGLKLLGNSADPDQRSSLIWLHTFLEYLEQTLPAITALSLICFVRNLIIQYL